MLDGWNPMMHVIIMLTISPGLCVYTVLKESVNNSEKTLLGFFSREGISNLDWCPRQCIYC